MVGWMLGTCGFGLVLGLVNGCLLFTLLLLFALGLMVMMFILVVWVVGCLLGFGGGCLPAVLLCGWACFGVGAVLVWLF